MFWIEMLIVLAAIVIGARLKGVGLGIMGGLGLVILVFGFHLRPTKPPIEILLIITAVITAISVLEGAGGLQYLVFLAEKLIRKRPHQITFIAPLVTYFFTFLSGTGHISYSLLAVIAEVARETGVRPERPLSVSVIASQQAVTASPISAATVLLVGILKPFDLELFDILKVCVPATLSGVLMATLVMHKMGKELHKDPIYLQRMDQLQSASPSATTQQQGFGLAKRAIMIFIMALVLIVIYGSFKSLRPCWNGEYMDMTEIIEVIMLAAAALTILLCKTKTSSVVKGNIFPAGMQAVIAIFGISWLGDTFFKANLAYIMTIIKSQIMEAPWQFSIFLFFLCVVLVSQSAAVRTLVPLGIAIGIPVTAIVAMFPASNGLFFLPSYPTLLAAINFDRTGTTRIGKYVLNHSFMLPGLVATTTATAVGFALVKLFF